MSIDLILVIGALFCFALAAINAKSPVNLIGLGLFLFVLRELV
jgi:hypothetical protein